MKRNFLLVFVFYLISACATTPAIPERTTDEAMLNFLPYLNQKVAGYLEENQLKTLDSQTYRQIVEKGCIPLPSCGKNAAVMFNTYTVQPRMLGGMFSVMLCNKEMTVKIMEDFSCNESKVEIANFQQDSQAQCIFEDKWKEKIIKDCPNVKE